MKEALRKNALGKRKALSEREKIEKSSAICNSILSLAETRNARTISCYVSVGSEVMTHSFISRLLAIGKRVVVPAVSGEKNKLEMCKLLSLKELEKKSAFFEPRQECRQIFPNKEIDLVLVPGIAFDESGFRIGYGKGYYDKFLKDLNRRIPLIGLAFECQLVERIPAEEHDIKLDKIVTEKRVIEC